MIRSLCLVLATSAFAISTAAYAEAPHVHGAGGLSIAVDETGALIELVIAADDAVGFEYAPKTDAEKAAVARAIDDLEFDGLFTFPPQASCQVKQQHADFELVGEHAEFHAEIDYECAEASAIQSVSTMYFELFVGTEHLETKISTPGGARALEWDADQTSIPLN